MNTVDINKYSYLWDGSQSGWCLSPLPTMVELKIYFDAEGATAKDVLKLKNCVPFMSEFSISELLSRFKGLTEIHLGQMDEANGENLVEALRLHGLNSVFLPIQDRYVIINQELNTILAIEDNDIYKAVKERMLAEGVQVV